MGTETLKESDGASTVKFGWMALLVSMVLCGAVGCKQDSATANGGPAASAAYAPKLALTGLQMSESESLSGGKDIYIDGQIANKGGATVTGVTVQVVFKNDEAMPPQMLTTPLLLIRAREPYIDTETVNAEPLKPGAQHDFRLTFENIATNWNQTLPEVRVVGVSTK